MSRQPRKTRLTNRLAFFFFLLLLLFPCAPVLPVVPISMWLQGSSNSHDQVHSNVTLRQVGRDVESGVTSTGWSPTCCHLLL
jgi:hypothetical protein